MRYRALEGFRTRQGSSRGGDSRSSDLPHRLHELVNGIRGDPSSEENAVSGYLTQPELYKLGALITLAFLAVYLLIRSPWVYFVTR